MKVIKGKKYKFKKNHKINSHLWGKTVKIIETNCNLPYQATIRAILIENNSEIHCYKEDFLPITNNIIKI